MQFGVGSATKIDRLTVRRPTGNEQVLTDVDVTQEIRVTESSGE
ncbi:MAG: hypothetical protein GY716_00670 [bacterium]|nr:hypothetical protein [bacterium]